MRRPNRPADTLAIYTNQRDEEPLPEEVSVDLPPDPIEGLMMGQSIDVDPSSGDFMEALTPEPVSSDFHENLADKLDSSELYKIADDILRWVEADKTSMREWQERLKDGLEILGITKVPTDQAPFSGACQMTFPLLAEAVVQFQARAVDELFPPAGPVKAVVVGDYSVDPELQEMASQAQQAAQQPPPMGDPMTMPPEAQMQAQAQAQEAQMQAQMLQQAVVEQQKRAEEIQRRRQRVEDYMNYQLTELDDEYFDETDMMLFYLPLAGSAFKKAYRDEVLGINCCKFVKGEDLIVPYTATTLKNAPRYTHRYLLVHNDLLKNQAMGYWSDVDVPEPSMEDPTGDRGPVVEATDEAEGRRPEHEDRDYRHTIYECHCDLDLPGHEDPTGIKLPYVVTIDAESRSVLRIQRNWRENDPLRRKRVWFIHYKYLPGLGFYGYGLLHFIGSLSATASATVNTLLNAGAFASLQGGFKTKEGTALQAGEMALEPGVYKEVDISHEDLQKSFFTPQFKEPSDALTKLLEYIVDTGRRFASITEAMTGEGDTKAPVGTTVAMIEQGGKVFSAIHKRMHQAARREFKLLAELNFDYLPVEGYPYQVGGQSKMIFADDFGPEVDVLPVSDPNIYSATQRVAIAQAVMETAMAAPTVVDVREAVQNLFEALRVPNPDSLLMDENSPPPPDPEMMKAEAEIKVKEAEIELKREMGQLQLQQKKEEHALDMQLKQQEMQMKMQMMQQKMQMDIQMQQMQFQMDQELAAKQHEAKMRMAAQMDVQKQVQMQRDAQTKQQAGMQQPDPAGNPNIPGMSDPMMPGT